MTIWTAAIKVSKRRCNMVSCKINAYSYLQASSFPFHNFIRYGHQNIHSPFPRLDDLISCHVLCFPTEPEFSSIRAVSSTHSTDGYGFGPDGLSHPLEHRVERCQHLESRLVSAVRGFNTHPQTAVISQMISPIHLLYHPTHPTDLADYLPPGERQYSA